MIDYQIRHTTHFHLQSQHPCSNFIDRGDLIKMSGSGRDFLKNIKAKLTEISSSKTPSQRPPAYLAILREILSQPSSVLPSNGEYSLKEAISVYLQFTALSDTNATGGNLVVGRQVLRDFDEAIVEAGKKYQDVQNDDAMSDSRTTISVIADEDVQIEILESALEQLQPRVLSFEDQANTIRLHLADTLENTEQWTEAARVLQGISLDSSHRFVSDLHKLRIYVRIVRLLLEGDNAVGADTMLKRASLLVHNVPGVMSSSFGISNNPTLQEAWSKMSEEEKIEAKTLGLQFKLSQARIYDSQRRFAEAANRYHEVSYVTEIDEAERTMMLSAAVTASILAPAGPQRSRILATLARDERTASLPQHTILTKTFLDQIIRPNEIKSFEKILSPHQLASLPKSEQDLIRDVRSSKDKQNGDVAMSEEDEEDKESSRTGPSTVLDRAMMEHNIIAASRLYVNITLNGLGRLLDLHSLAAETMVRRMIVQGRLKAEIDQVAGLIVFHEQKSSEIGLAAGGASGAAGGKESEQAKQEQGQGEDDDLSTVYTRRWDVNIAKSASGVEEVCARLRTRGYLKA